MESTDSSAGSQQPQLPPGFRFHPTDEELVVHYLKRKADSAPLPVAIIADVNLYKFDPWELPAKATFGEQEWYFFTPRDRKYPNGARPNRAATSGYWKATGTDKPVLTSDGTHKLGVKKALVFYKGKPPKGVKTNWIMHEFRLADTPNNKPPGCNLGNKKGSLRLDDWVLCRIYKRNNTQRPLDHERDDSMNDMLASIPPSLQVEGSGSQPNLKLHGGLHKASSFRALFENEHNIFYGGGMLSNNDIVGSTSAAQLASSSSGPPSQQLPMKRTVLNPFWNNEGSKKYISDNNSNVEGNMGQRMSDDSTSIASLLSQLPQTPQLQQQAAMLGSIGDGVFQQSYQLPGMNWYS